MRDYAELVKGLRCCSKIDARNNGCDSCPYEYCGDDCQNLCGCAADAIEELLAAVPQWISVEEWLPDVGKLVLVSDGDDIDTACRYKAFTIPDEAETFFWDTVLEVTHWMLLPEPPKEVE